MLKLFFLLQIAYWLHMFPELYFMKARKVRDSFRDQSSSVLGRGLEDISLITKMFHKPFISPMRFSRALNFLAAIFDCPSLYQIQ